jgi:Tfp pilus assembly protein PilF
MSKSKKIIQQTAKSSLHKATFLTDSISDTLVKSFPNCTVYQISEGFDFGQLDSQGFVIYAQNLPAAQAAYEQIQKSEQTTIFCDQNSRQAVLASFFAPFDQPGGFAGAAILPAQSAGEVLNHPLRHLGLPYVLKHLNIQAEFIGLDNIEGEKKSVTDYFKQNLSAFGYRFFKEPFAVSKRDIFTNENHPIYRFKFLFFVALMAVLMPILSFDYGITWDEPEHVTLAQDMRKYYTTLGSDTSVFDLSKHARFALLYYGASIDLLSEMVYHYLRPFGIYETRHFINALYGVLGAIFTGLLAKELGGWRAAFLAAFLMLLSPRYFGHSMNNPKDIPFLTGYAMSLYFLILLMKQLPKPRMGTILWTGFGVAFIISLKIGGLLNLAYVGLFMGLWWLFFIKEKGFVDGLKQIPNLAKIFAIVAFIGYFFGILFWPYGIIDPLNNPFKALKEFTNFQLLLTYELFEGKRLFMQFVPPHYIFKWIWISVPIAVLLGYFLGMALPFLQKRDRWNTAVWAMMIFALFFPIVYIIYKKSTLYSEWRHVLFVYAPMIALSSAGWNSLMKYKTGLSVAAMVVLLALFVRPVAWMVQEHPNQYLYFNEFVGGIKGAYTDYETDYWCNSMKQATEWMLENRPEIKNKKTRIATNFAYVSAQYYFEKATDSVRMLWARENEKYKEDWDYAFFGTRTMCKAHIQNAFPPKGTIHTIEVDGVPVLAIVEKTDRNLNLSLQARAKGNDSLALEYGLKALEYDPKNVETYRHLAQVYLSRNQLDKAIDISEQCLKVNPEDFTSYTILGMIYTQSGKHDKALEMLEKAIEFKINNVGAYQYKAEALFRKGELEKAYQAIEKAIEYDQNRNANIQYLAAYIKVQQAAQLPALKLQIFDEAFRHIQMCININPNFADAYNMAAYMFEQAGQAQEAAKFRAQYNKLKGL